jgi:CRISPR-associated protein Csm1
MTDKNLYEVILGGLLHDVGKLGQRAHAPDEGLSPENLRMAETVCPTRRDGGHSHRHVLYTAEFCDRVQNLVPPELDRAKVLRLATFHHRPSDPEEEIIGKADGLSACMERLEDEDTLGKGFRKVRMTPVVSEVDIGAGPGEKNVKFVMQMGRLRDDLNLVFPLSAEDKSLVPPLGEDLRPAYKELWDGLIQSWDENHVKDLWGFTARALSTLEMFTWCVPSATNVLPDISLYDHMKTTAAIAGCLYLTKNENQKPFLLVAGDFGGIQQYIFDLRVGAGGLAKGLRGRSFKVSMVVESISHHILKSSGLPLTNRFIAAGGRFYLLLPNVDRTHEVLESTRREVDRWSVENMEGELRFNLAQVELAEDDLGNFSHALGRVNEELHFQKHKALSTTLSGSNWDSDAFVLPVLEIADEESICRSCMKKAGKPEGRGGAAICKSCKDDRDFGGLLPKSNVLSFTEERGLRIPYGDCKLYRGWQSDIRRAYIALDMVGDQQPPPEVPSLRTFYAGYIPSNDDGEPLTFQEIAERSKGRTTIACLKADVDNLGFIFSKGLQGGKNLSISRLTTLSRSLDFFFAGYFQQLLRAQFSNVYAIYAGGDDLLCLGPWHETLDLAAMLHDEFQKFTCMNPSWGLSAGIVLVAPRTPVLQIVKLAERLLGASKAAEGKNRITAFGTTLPWSGFSSALERGKLLLTWLEAGVVRSSQIQRLLMYAGMYRKYEETRHTRYLRFVPLLTYDLKRNWKTKTVEEIEARDWAQSLLDVTKPEVRLLRFVCEYALNGARASERSA